MIPFLLGADPSRAVVETAEAMVAYPQGHEPPRDTPALLWIRDLEMTAQTPVLSATGNGCGVLNGTHAIRGVEGDRSHYLGMMAEPVTEPGEVAQPPGRASIFRQCAAGAASDERPDAEVAPSALNAAVGWTNDADEHAWREGS